MPTDDEQLPSQAQLHPALMIIITMHTCSDLISHEAHFFFWGVRQWWMVD